MPRLSRKYAPAQRVTELPSSQVLNRASATWPLSARERLQDQLLDAHVGADDGQQDSKDFLQLSIGDTLGPSHPDEQADHG